MPNITSFIRFCKKIMGMCGLWTFTLVPRMYAAAIYDGGGPAAGVGATTGLAGIPHTGDPRGTIINVIQTVLNFMALLATAAVIIAGIYLIVGMGSDESREKAKKIILYTLIGLTIILLSQVIVGLVTHVLKEQIA